MITQTSWQSQGMWTQPRSQLRRRCWSCSQIPCITRLKIWPVIKYFKYLLCHLSVLGQSVNGLKVVFFMMENVNLGYLFSFTEQCLWFGVWTVFVTSVSPVSSICLVSDPDAGWWCSVSVPGASLGLIWVFTRSLDSHLSWSHHTWHRPQNGAWTDTILCSGGINHHNCHQINFGAFCPPPLLWSCQI